ncbi:MAG: cation transporter, partial [Bacteroidota bacterium]|nr:cation transporter [Bacteroidota bacterium]MDX5431665.1 cation transporter [Bacteroidota bacterium]MDX5470383.1 cation transporter [Bacteroidota bacterium]
MAAKFFAWYLSDSNAILTDALESIVNVLAGIFAWYSLWLSFKPKDHDHPYAHGKIEFISATIEGVLIAVAGVSIVAKSTYNLFFPQEIHHLDSGILLITLAGLANGLMGYV